MHRTILSTAMLLPFCLGLLACGPALDTEGETSRGTLGRDDGKEELQGYVEVRLLLEGGFAAPKNGVAWVYSKQGEALRAIDWSSWQATLDTERCFFHESLEFPIGDDMHYKKGHVCFATLEPAPPPTLYLMAAMVFSDGSGWPLLPVQDDGTYTVVGVKSLFKRIGSDCRAHGNPGDRVIDVVSNFDPKLTVECERDGIAFTYYAYLPTN